jgi:hypothetical protein
MGLPQRGVSRYGKADCKSQRLVTDRNPDDIMKKAERVSCDAVKQWKQSRKTELANKENKGTVLWYKHRAVQSITYYGTGRIVLLCFGKQSFP